MSLHRAVSVVLLLVLGCASPRVIRLDTGEGRPLEYVPPTWDRSVGVDKRDFEHALARLVLEVPMSLRPSEAGLLVRASTYGATLDSTWHGVLRNHYGRWCRAHEAVGDCLSLLEDGLHFSPTDKLSLALGMSLEPMRESIGEAVRDTLNPQFFYAVVVTGLASWVALAAAPEPVFTKAAAVMAAVVMVYLGLDAFLSVVKACFELKQASDAARTFQELEEAGVRFGGVLGQQGARVFVLAMTVLLGKGVTGGVAGLASRMPMLPAFAEASAVGASQVGLNLAAVGAVSAVSITEGSLALTLAPGAVAMAALGPNHGGAASGAVGFKAWGSSSGLRKALGSAGPGRQWHHVVEQTPGNVQRFGPHSLHNTQNVIPLDTPLHERVSAFYSSKRFFITNSETLTVREWLSTQSFTAQRDFGLMAIQNIQKGIWR
jgi:hypothetical protein